MIRKNKTYFIDQTSEGEHHMVFNASFIDILNQLFPENLIYYSGIQSSQKHVFEALNENLKQKVVLREINYYKTISNHLVLKGFNFILKEFLRFFKFLEIFLSTNKNDVICLSITTFSSLFFFKVLSLFFNRKIITVLHGDIDFIYIAKNKNEKINALFYRLIFKLKKKNFKYILLNKISKSILVRDGYLNTGEVIEINHPYTFDNQELKIVELNYPIKFAHNGSMEIKRKNSHFIFELAENLKNEILNKKIEFYVIGLATDQINPFKNNWVNISVGEQKNNIPPYLPRHQYETEMLKMNYILFFFPENEYVFRASGAVIDAIAFEKPILAIKHPFFENIFNQCGEIGYLCENLTEMEGLIFELTHDIEKYKSDYKKQILNLKALKYKFSTQAITIDIKLQNN